MKLFNYVRIIRNYTVPVFTYIAATVIEQYYCTCIILKGSRNGRTVWEILPETV